MFVQEPPAICHLCPDGLFLSLVLVRPIVIPVSSPTNLPVENEATGAVTKSMPCGLDRGLLPTALLLRSRIETSRQKTGHNRSMVRGHKGSGRSDVSVMAGLYRWTAQAKGSPSPSTSAVAVSGVEGQSVEGWCDGTHSPLFAVQQPPPRRGLPQTGDHFQSYAPRRWPGQVYLLTITR